ncbi:E3 SUMO-protein ligase PIAS2-like isoform X2 [Mya arenaria]|uniref:E3 SUMO-protein ligase PIAS2-like isoform X2 n=2 Tax=Mya arenaria TaxID=6604 RepID=UPI0022DEAB76|nr:E3 SUMO-protein ligase PIAS2-like isoform X2 [Mya arenaria]
MAEAEELKQMVLSFRRNELVDLLGFVGMNKTGVKATLLQRAVTLINSSRGCSVPVQIKIRELYRQIHNPYATEPPRTRNPPRAAAQLADPRLRGKYPTPGGSKTSMNTSSMLPSAVDFSKRAQELAAAAGVQSLPVHPDVRFKPLPFFDIMGELLKPTSLSPKGISRYQETYFVFHLTPQQAQDIAMSRDFRPTAKWEYTAQVQLRFCFLETSCEQDDNFPPSICVRVNGKVAQLPNPIPTTKPGVEPKRPGRPVDITSLCRLSPTMPNHVEISWASEFGRGFVVSINLVKRLTSDTLLQRLKEFGNRHPDHTRAMIKEKLHHDADSEIATTSLRVSLVCPLGKMRMQLPCRAESCKHLQCFDATTYLMMNEKKPTWLCPVCDKQTPFNKLNIDRLFCEILQSTDESEIQFVEDGSWSAIKNKETTHTIQSTPSRSANESAVNLCDGDSDSPGPSPAAKKPKMEVIDLTLSDSEDDEPASVAQSSTHEISSGCSTPSMGLGSCSVPSGSATVSDSLPPMPPLLAFDPSLNNLTNQLNSMSNGQKNTEFVGLNLSTRPSSSSIISTKREKHSDSETDSWLSALSGHMQGQKRPHSGSGTAPPPQKRAMMDQLASDSPASSNSNMSPLVDLDQLCSILDSDRDRHKEEISSVLSFPSDFPMSGSASNSRSAFSVSPSDIIALD